ncbi:MAG TPA: cupin domain-containing protein [Steroidobacteraceae bacterium]|nr:cupin domain-containing protein [Steroidobacteraceae bacterium]
MSDKPVINIRDVPLADRGHGARFQVKFGRIGPLVGVTKLGCSLHVVPPGKRAFPRHAHHETDELFYIVSGSGEYRFGDESFPVQAGDVLGAPAGKIAHQIINTGREELRYLGLSTLVRCDVVEYPDSGKFGVVAGLQQGDFKTATFRYMGRAATPLDYWDGEPADD